MKLHFGRALYYPYINFRDDNWLKLAALFYDGVDRIVPSLDLLEERELIERINENAESEEKLFVRNIDPRPYANDVANEFINYLTLANENPEVRNQLYQELQHIVQPSDKYYVHTAKMNHQLIKLLDNSGVDVEHFLHDFEDFLILDKITGAIYMSRLANHIAEKKSLPIITDDTNFQIIAKEAQRDLVITDNLGEVLASMVIQSVIPRNMESITPKQIVRFRNDYNDERQEFYSKINELVTDLYQIEDEQSLRDALNFKKDEIIRANRRIESALRGLKIDTALGLFSLSIPSFASGLGWAVASAGLASVAMGKLAVKGIDYKKSKNGSPYSYALSLKNNLARENLAESLLRGKTII